MNGAFKPDFIRRSFVGRAFMPGWADIKETLKILAFTPDLCYPTARVYSRINYGVHPIACFVAGFHPAWLFGLAWGFIPRIFKEPT